MAERPLYLTVKASSRGLVVKVMDSWPRGFNPAVYGMDVSDKASYYIVTVFWFRENKDFDLMNKSYKNFQPHESWK